MPDPKGPENPGAMATPGTSTAITIEPKQSLLRRKLNSAGNKIKNIVEKGRQASTDPTELVVFRGLFRSINLWFDEFRRFWDDLLDHYAIVGDRSFPDKSDKDLCMIVERYFNEANTLYEEFVVMAKPVTPLPSEFNKTEINSSGVNTTRAHLPRIVLPQFSGKLKEWPYFRDRFISLVHEDVNIPDVDKFFYLSTSLSGPALASISEIAIVAQNYQAAWDAVNRTYDKKRVMASTYLNYLIDFKPMKMESIDQLNTFLSEVAENISALKRLKIPNFSEFILFSLAIRCLDPKTRRSFEKEHKNIDFPNFEDLVSFVRGQVEVLELSSETFPDDSCTSKATGNKPKKNRYGGVTSSYFVTEPSDSTPTVSSPPPQKVLIPKCPVCRATHFLWRCQEFRQKSVDERHKLLKTIKACNNCLKSDGHSVRDCKSKGLCLVCGKKHHTLLHYPTRPQIRTSDQGTHSNLTQSSQPLMLAPTTDMAGTTSAISSNVILGTAMALIRDNQGHFQPLRLVVDSGSHHSFITTDCARRLGLRIIPSKRRVIGVGQNLLGGIKGQAECNLCSTFKPQRSTNLRTDAIVIDSITTFLPSSNITTPHWFGEYYHQLADTSCFTPGEVQFLLGADLFPEILTGPCIKPSEDSITFLDTVFGLVLIGKVPTSLPSDTTSSLFVSDDVELRSILRKFWEIEEPVHKPLVSPEEEKCEEHYQKTHYRLPSGRYGVRLPFKESDLNFRGSESVALKRFYNLEAKLIRNTDMYTEYRRFMEEYLASGHMKMTSESSSYVIPHHGVSKGLKFRVVFDASCSVNNHSLNDSLYVGSKLQSDISEILLNFRLHAVVFTTDMVKMFRQIMVHPEDRPYLHIFWRPDVSEKIQKYELTTITYGLSSSPFQALRTIKQLVLDEGHAFPLASRVLKEDLYVDDIATGASTVNEALYIKTELINLLEKGGFSLSKWKSNCHQLLPAGVEEETLDFSPCEENIVKVLGLQWKPSLDSFTYKAETFPRTATKRSILSCIARIYDPLGFLAPTILFGKLLLQSTWKAGVGWDEQVPENIRLRWLAFVEQLPMLSNITVPRHLVGATSNRCYLICFSDASEVGYGGAIYLKVLGSKLPPFLLKAKTRLAPLKTLTIPKLELCAALLLAKLFSSLKPFLRRITCEKIFCFTDSTVVLGWLSTEPHLLKIFVANRVVETTKYLPSSLWYHIKSNENPADCASRGVIPSQLIGNPLWWSGPSWLNLPVNGWPISKNIVTKPLPELKPSATFFSVDHESQYLVNYMEQFSSYMRLLRVVAYCLRFVRRIRGERISGPISSDEITTAKFICVKLVQDVYFTQRDNASMKQLKSLSPFVDSRGLLRVGGRLVHSSLDEDAKHPIILPKQCYLSTLIIDYFHYSHLHAGPSLLSAIIRQEFWIISSRNLIRQRVFKCIKCHIARKRVPTQLMGNLPPHRLEGGRVFQHVGVDFAGPFSIRESLRRKSAIGKAYLCLFVCMASMALHLEAVTSLSTEAFLAGLDRFIARRGRPFTIYSDCGSNFLGAAKHLQDLNKWYASTEIQESIQEHLAPSGIKWSFNPPYAPHFGGLWEAGVKSTKTILRKIMSEPPLTYEELSTLFARIEAVLNSRPLCPLTSDYDDYNFLTPGHFIIGTSLTAPPEASLMDVKDNRLKRWQLVQKRLQEVWRRWKDEYLHLLQQRPKWTQTTRNVAIGDLVVMVDPQARPLQWPMARVIQVHPGHDGIVRVVTVKTNKGQFNRPIGKIVPLFSDNFCTSN